MTAFPLVLRLPEGWLEAELCSREKRFTAHLTLPDGSLVQAHCANTGSMRGCLEVPQPAVISPARREGRKLPWTLEMICHRGVWTEVNTGRAAAIFEALWRQQLLPEFASWGNLRREVSYGTSRFDLEMENDEGRKHIIELKQVTMAVGEDACFPDSPSERGQKHLRGLMECVRQGHSATMVYLVKRGDCRRFRPAREIDPRYAELLEAASMAGVNVLPLSFAITPGEIRYRGKLPWLL